jgi:hypothetical protein
MFSVRQVRPLFRRASAIAIANALALAGALVCAQDKAGDTVRRKEAKVTEFTRYWDDKPVVPQRPAQAIAPAQAIGAGPRAAAGAPDCIRVYVNDERNSRAGGPLGYAPGAPFTPLWKSDLQPGLYPRAVLAARDRIVVYGGGLWSLFDAGGRLVASKSLSGSEVILDPEHSLLFAANSAGLITGYHIATGAPVFSATLHFGKDYARPFLARRDRLLVTVGIAKDIDSHAPPPEQASVEIIDLGNPAAPKSWDQPGGAVSSHDLIRETRILLTAMVSNAIWMATENRLYRADLSLDLRNEFTGSFSPIEMAMDEESNAYITVELHGRQALWKVTSSGQRAYAFDFPPGVPAPARPPVIAYDHTAYLLSGRQVLSVAPDGKANWTRTAPGQMVGAIATSDDVLVVSENDCVSAWDARGQRKPLYQFQGEQVATPPTLLPGGDLLVATETRLYRLRGSR